MPTHVTRFEAQDASAVRELIVQGLAERWGRYDPRFNPDLENFAEHYNSSVILVAKRGSRIVGVGVLQPEAGGVGRIVRMSVAGDCRRRGIGTLILEGLLQAARERGYESAVLETTASWESAVRFYVSRGFIPTEARDGDQGFVLALTESGHPMQIQCAAILFDLDGVLIDSTDSVTRHWQQWAERHNLDLAEIMKVAHGRRTVETMRLIAPHLATAEEAQRFAAMEAADTQGVIAVDGALPLLSRLPPEAWAIVTSGTRDLATARLKSRGLPICQESDDNVPGSVGQTVPLIVGQSVPTSVGQSVPVTTLVG